jgi:hypothetical protein
MKYIKACLLTISLISCMSVTGCYVDEDDHDHWRHHDDNRRLEHREEEWHEHHDRW